jgi:hypothetical protein
MRAYSLEDFTPAPPLTVSGSPPAFTGDVTSIKRIADLDELDKWQVPVRVKAIIVQGHDATSPKPDDNSRSAWLFDVTCNLVRCGVPNGIIFAIITDRDLGISASVLDKGSKANSYATQQIKRAKEAIATSTQTENAKRPGDPIAIVLQEMNELHAVIENYGNKTRVMTERPSPFFQSFDDFRNIYMNKRVSAGTDEDGKPIMMARGKWWLGHALRRQYKRVEFMPGKEPPEGVFNLWRGFPVAPMPGTCDLFVALLRDTICAGCDTYSEWLLDWMAHAIQQPQEPGEVAVVLRGGQGIGKSFLAEHFGELFGRHFVPLTDPKHVVGNFNHILHDALFVFADEAFAANDKRAEGILKGLVTQSHITIEPKGVDAFKARRFFRMLLASNNSWVVPADVDDRRFLVLDVGTVHKYDTAYFGAIDAEWKRGGREALMHVLLNHDIARFDHRRRPNTPALMDQKLHTLRGAPRVIYDMLASGDPPVAKVDGDRIFIATRDLHRDTTIKCSETALGRALASLADQETAIREQCDDHRIKGFWLPRLSEARKRWGELSKLEGVRWPRDDGEWTSSTADMNPSGEGEEPPF